jgi:biopolymer transport protein ExbD
MSMAVSGPANSCGHDIAEMNTTPLIDVMLVLLVMLIVTIPLQTHAVKLDMPLKPPPSAPRPVVDVVDLEIDFDGTPIWNGMSVPDWMQLDGYLLDAAAKSPQPEVHLRPNRLAKYDAVARTLAHAQRVGLTKIGFVGNEQYIE